MKGKTEILFLVFQSSLFYSFFNLPLLESEFLKFSFYIDTLT